MMVWLQGLFHSVHVLRHYFIPAGLPAFQMWICRDVSEHPFISTHIGWNKVMTPNNCEGLVVYLWPISSCSHVTFLYNFWPVWVLSLWKQTWTKWKVETMYHHHAHSEPGNGCPGVKLTHGCNIRTGYRWRCDFFQWSFEVLQPNILHSPESIFLIVRNTKRHACKTADRTTVTWN